MNVAAFDAGALALHLAGILFVVAFVRLGDYAWHRGSLSVERRIAGDAVLSVSATAIIYAFMFDSSLLRTFDPKGILVILFGGVLVCVLMQLRSEKGEK